MNILGQAVKHKKYGKGVITDFSDNNITVCFAESQKLFQFPEAFPQYLTLKNNSIQTKIELLNEERLREMETRKQSMERENKYRNRMYTMKIPLKSQVAYDILEEEIVNLDYLQTGCYLSGDLKGTPRTASNVQPNSAIIMTDCGNDKEDGRCIIGIAMADEYFWGKECREKPIKLHHKYKLLLSYENRVSFWKYFKREAFPAQWGRVPFKYFQNQTMEKILFDICSMAVGTEQEDETRELYSYFCSVNRIPEKTIT